MHSTVHGGKQWQATPKNLPRMQRTRAIPVAWLNSGLCPDRPNGWIPIIIKIMSGNIICLLDLGWKHNASDLPLFIINLFLSDQGKTFPLILSRLKIKSCVCLPVIKMLLSSAKSVSLMPISLLILVSLSWTYIRNNSSPKMEPCGSPISDYFLFCQLFPVF